MLHAATDNLGKRKNGNKENLLKIEGDWMKASFELEVLILVFVHNLANFDDFNYERRRMYWYDTI